MTIEKQKQEFDRRATSWRRDWNCFAHDFLGARLDKEQQEVLSLVQNNPRVSVCSGTSRGKDYVAACAALCFFYLTPEWASDKQLIRNTKVILTAPTDRQVRGVMMPEIARLYNYARQKNNAGSIGRLLDSGIKTNYPEWYLNGFTADENNPEAWSGLHAANIMFVVTEASGISDKVFASIEGCLQGNSRILLVFNPNNSTGYAAKTQLSHQWKALSLNSLNATNVKEKREVYIGQVNYDWVCNRIEEWCVPIHANEVREDENDFEFNGQYYRPDDIFRVKVLGVFPKISNDVLISLDQIRRAKEREVPPSTRNENKILGVDVAGMGRDSTVFVERQGYCINSILKHNSGGKADHMRTAGHIANWLSNNPGGVASIDTIGEGAGVYSRLVELGYGDRVMSCKYSEAARTDERDLSDSTEQYRFANMRAYLFWCVREWLSKAHIPIDDGGFGQEGAAINWHFRSDGRVIIEPKDDIKKRIGRSIDVFDAVANTFYPAPENNEFSVAIEDLDMLEQLAY
ncbi:MAG: hypothetical protein LBG17_04630 [Bacteroidales bacterium]|jgi:hypothetical protein|nr:hypothetical protein [Bacteroidales bacterium]